MSDDDKKKNPRAGRAVGDDPFADFDLSWLEPESEAEPEPEPPPPPPQPAREPDPPPVPPSDPELFAWLTPGIPPKRETPPAPKPPPDPKPDAATDTVAWLLSRERPAVTAIDADEADAALDAWLTEEEDS